MTLEYAGPNAEQIKYWNEISGPKWVALHEQIDAQIAPFGQRAIDRAALQPGERVIDVGCGCGITTMEIARRVGAHGAVTGVDICTPMIELARRRAAEAGFRHVRFENADAQTFAFAAGAADVLFSRFGVMFFSDATTAFANLQRALRPGGRVAFVCWRGVQENPWMLVPLMAAAQHIPLPAPPAPGAPGPFSFADAAHVGGVLAAAGYADVACEPLDLGLRVAGGGSLDGAVEFLLQMGPTGAAMRAAGPEQHDAVAAAVRAALAPYVTAAGVEMAAAAWIVTARRP